MPAGDLAIAQLDAVLAEFRDLRARSRHDDLSDLPEGDAIRFITRARAAIERIAGSPSAYVDQCERHATSNAYAGYIAIHIVGVVESLKADVDAGFLDSQRELLHGELFADFLEMSQHLLEEGYKDAAAVIAGSSLEAHLRQLCAKSGVDVQVRNSGGAVPKRADRLNAELEAAGAYGKLDLKNVTAWLDLRNKAAHGRYGEYEVGQVALLIAGVRDFITRHPA
jgi:hypothetical protein